uniref:Uncharacterized protein n=1 Tax=Rhizophora mucronata TaxID=61149 RepID=A0A2P2PEU7_RHIMU
MARTCQTFSYCLFSLGISKQRGFLEGLDCS